MVLRPLPAEHDPTGHGRWNGGVRLAPLFTLRAPDTSSAPVDHENAGSTRVGFPLFDSVFSALRKKNPRPRLGAPADEDIDVWRNPRFGKSDQTHAERGYSFVRMLPTVCLTAGVLTLSMTVGSGEKFVLQAKPARMGGLIGFKGRFD